MNEMLRNVLENYGFTRDCKVKAEDIRYETNRQPHVWTINDDYLLKMTLDVEELKRHLQVSTLLKTVNINTQTPLLTLTNESYVKVDDYYFILVEKLKGSILEDYFAEDEMQMGFELGQILATLQGGLKIITPKLENLWDNHMSSELEGWVNEEIEHYVLTSTLTESEISRFIDIKERCLTQFRALYEQLPRQAIHRDFHGGNLIFNNKEFVGFIDFDLSQRNARLFDICYLCTGALASSYEDEEKREKWLNFVIGVFNGYNELSVLTKEEKNLAKDMMIAIDLVMVAFFARDGYINLVNLNISMINWIETHVGKVVDCLS